MTPLSGSGFNTGFLPGRNVIFPALFLLCMSAPLNSQDLPVSERSRTAAERVREGLSRALGEKGMRYGNPVFIRILKEEAELELYVEEADKKTFKLFRSYRIAAMSGQLGPKEREGQPSLLPKLLCPPLELQRKLRIRPAQIARSVSAFAQDSSHREF